MTDLPINLSAYAARRVLAGEISQLRRPTGALSRLQPKDRLWVREPFALLPRFDQVAPLQVMFTGDRTVVFVADGVGPAAGRLRFARELPKLLHRMHLVVTAVRMERLQDVTDADARIEGARDRAEFAARWDALNAPTAQSISGGKIRWADNPRMVVITFERLRGQLP